MTDSDKFFTLKNVDYKIAADKEYEIYPNN